TAMAAGAITPPQFFERRRHANLFACREWHCQGHPKTRNRRSRIWTAARLKPNPLAIGPRRRIFENMANTSSAKKATRKIARRTIVNKSRRTQMRGAVRIVEEAIKSGDRDAGLKAMAHAEPELMQAAQRNIIHKNNASRKVSRLAHQIAKLAKKNDRKKYLSKTARPCRAFSFGCDVLHTPRRTALKRIRIFTDAVPCVGERADLCSNR